MAREGIEWKCEWQIDRYKGQVEFTPDGLAVCRDELVLPYDQDLHEGNLLMYGGASCLWEFAMGNGTTTADQTLTYFSTTRAAIGVGDSSTAAAATQTNLQAATNLVRKLCSTAGSYPSHTDATTSGAATITFKSSFDTSSANWAWNEWGIFNTATAATGRMLNRKVSSMGTKTSSDTWTLSIAVTLS